MLHSVPSNLGRCLDWILILSMLAACSQKDMLQKFASPAEQAIAQKYIDELRSLDFDRRRLEAKTGSGSTLTPIGNAKFGGGL
jgi:hypothetical protein